MITYAAGLSEKAPRNTALVGPLDPTGNARFPTDMMSLALPFEIARKMAKYVEGSFLEKRCAVAFPAKRLGMDEKAEASDLGGPPRGTPGRGTALRAGRA